MATPSYLEMRRRFLANRAAFPAEELAKYAGQWVAWSPDGTRIAASAQDPKDLDVLLRKCGEDPAYSVIEGILGNDAEQEAWAAMVEEAHSEMSSE